MADGRLVDAVYVKPTPDQYPADYAHRVVITEGTRHGPAKRHTYVRRFPKSNGPSRWRSEPAISFKTLAHEHKQHGDRPIPGSASPPLEAGTTVVLCNDVDIPVGMLVFILDACASVARHQIDIADIKMIVSQLGSRISQIETLDGEQRRLAEPALYAEILRRCTTIGSVSSD